MARAKSSGKRKPPAVRLTWSGRPDEPTPLPTVQFADLSLVEWLGPEVALAADPPSDSPDEVAASGDQMELPPAGDGAAGGQLPGPTAAASDPNIIVRGDNLLAACALAERYRESIELIYIDPPYATGMSYYAQVGVGEQAVRQRAYTDQRRRGLVDYLMAMEERLRAFHALLAPTGKIFVHCDWRANSALRILLDEIFGQDCFRNEIIWRRAPNLGRQAAASQLGRVIDTILVYSKTAGSAFGGTMPKRRRLLPLDRKGKPKGSRWDEEQEAYFTTAPRGDYTDESIERLRGEGRVHVSNTGTVSIKYFLTKGDDGKWYKEQPVDALWDDFEVRPLRHRPKSEAMGYDTQKPEGLLERIMNWSTKPGDLVADFCCGSGTLPAVAEKLGRRWIACDAGKKSLQVTRLRLLEMRRRVRSGGSVGPTISARPIAIYDLEKSERITWAGRLASAGVVPGLAAAQAVWDAYGCDVKSHEVAANGYGALHGGEFVWVGALDGTNNSQVDEAARVAAACGASSLVAIAFDWSTTNGRALRGRVGREHGLEVSLRRVTGDLIRGERPRGGFRFWDRPEIELGIDLVSTNAISVSLTDVQCPSLELDGITADSWEDLVAGWMVEIGYGGDTFRPTWQSWRGRDRPLHSQALALPYQPGEDTIFVRVVTVFGDEIDRTLRVAP